MSNIAQDIQKYFQQQGELYPREIFFNTHKNNADDDALAENPLDNFHKELRKCTRCGLTDKCKQKVPGKGDIDAKLMLVGEAPGKEEDKKGEPFVGRSGQLLDKILAAIDLTRQEVFISNIVKCRPPGNRNPHKEEIRECLSHLEQEIAIVDPGIIVALGLIAANTLLGTEDSLKNLRQQEHEYEGKILIPTYHPSALLQNPKYKRPAWEDFKKVKKIYFDK